MANVDGSMLNRVSALILKTRKLALSHLAVAVQKLPEWRPRYTRNYGHVIAIAPSPPIKFLDIGTKTGLYEIRELTPSANDKSDLLLPRSNEHGISRPETFHGVLYERLEKKESVESKWCEPSAWFNHSPTFHFHTKDSFGYIWGLPVLVPTCPEKLFAQGPMKKYVDIVTDTLHASSSDLITWNTLVTKRLKWTKVIPELWLEITAASLDAWDRRDQQSPLSLR